MPVVYGVAPGYQDIAGLQIVTGRFFDDTENDNAMPVCVLGEGARENLFPQTNAVGEYIKINEQWFHVIGIIGPQLAAQSELTGLKAQDLNNLIYAPLEASLTAWKTG